MIAQDEQHTAIAFSDHKGPIISAVKVAIANNFSGEGSSIRREMWLSQFWVVFFKHIDGSAFNINMILKDRLQCAIVSKFQFYIRETDVEYNKRNQEDMFGVHR